MISAKKFSFHTSLSLKQQATATAFFFIAPALIIILAVTLQPVVSTFYMSFFDTTMIKPGGEFVGLGNYQYLLSNPTFWETVQRSMYFTVVSVSIELALGIALAQLITSHPPGWRILRTCLIIPWAVPTIVNGFMWRWIYNADYGALNGLLQQLGLIDRYVPWLNEPFRAMNLVIVADVWHATPFIALIVQAAMASIPSEIVEAAAVDGASAWTRFWSIRMPLLLPAILVSLIIRTVEAFRAFDIVYVLTQGGPAFGTVTISYLTYLETFSYGRIGRGSALSFLISAITIVIAYIYIRVLYKPELQD